VTNNIWEWSAVQTAAAIKNGTISSREAVLSVLERIDAVNPHVNAIVEISADEALLQASEADRQLAEALPTGPLHGVPVTIKINSDQAGHATTNGERAFKDLIAEADAPHVLNWRNAGAVFIGRTNTPAYSIRWFTDNDLHGRTLNPWDEGRTPGGSSGGAAVAVATGMGALAHGNDIGGSIRYPAASCGVVGIRPTPGRVPSWSGPRNSDQLLGVQNMQVQGTLARNIADARLGLSAMAVWSADDPFCVPVPQIGPPLVGPIRVGVVRDVGIMSPDPVVDRTITEAARSLEAAGYVVEEVNVPLLAEAWRLWWQLVKGIESSDLASRIGEFGDTAARKVADNQMAVARALSSKFDLDTYIKGYARRGTLMRELQLFLEKYPILITPISAEQTFELDQDVQGEDRMAELAAAQWPMMALATLGFPALAVPVSLAGGLPYGVQLVGRRFREDTLFDAGEIIEAHAHVATPIDPRGARLRG
jgi:amidase